MMKLVRQSWGAGAAGVPAGADVMQAPEIQPSPPKEAETVGRERRGSNGSDWLALT